MKGKKEGGEKKGRREEKRKGESKKERGKGIGEKNEEKLSHCRARTRDLPIYSQPTASRSHVGHITIPNFDDMTVAALTHTHSLRQLLGSLHSFLV